jgi:hypothetical protein
LQIDAIPALNRFDRQPTRATSATDHTATSESSSLE